MARPKRDPLLAAMIAKLPDPKSGDWPVDRQIAWLNLMAMAFGTVYGGDAASMLGAPRQPVKAMETVKAPVKAEPQYSFYIDRDGVAKRTGGQPINPADVKGGTIFDLRGDEGDMKTIKWANGSTGLNGADVIVHAV